MADTVFNKEEVEKAVKFIKDSIPTNKTYSYGNIGRFAGLDVYAEPSPPAKLRLSENVMVTEEFRNQFNDWLLAEFGRKESLLDNGKFYYLEKHGAIIAPEHALSILNVHC